MHSKRESQRSKQTKILPFCRLVRGLSLENPIASTTKEGRNLEEWGLQILRNKPSYSLWVKMISSYARSNHIQKRTAHMDLAINKSL